MTVGAGRGAAGRNGVADEREASEPLAGRCVWDRLAEGYIEEYM